MNAENEATKPNTTVGPTAQPHEALAENARDLEPGVQTLDIDEGASVQYTFTKPWMQAAVEGMRRTGTMTGAAEAGNVNRTTVYRNAEKDELFARALSEAHDAMLDSIESFLLIRARGGQPFTRTKTRTYKDGSVETIVEDDRHLSDSAAFFLLKRFRPEYRDTYKVEQSGTLRVKIDSEAVNGEIEGLLAGLGA